MCTTCLTLLLAINYQLLPLETNGFTLVLVYEQINYPNPLQEAII